MNKKYLTFKEVVDKQLNNIIDIEPAALKNLIYHNAVKGHNSIIYLDNDLKEEYKKDIINFYDFDNEIINVFMIGNNWNEDKIEKIIKNGSLTVLKVETFYETKYFMIVYFGNDWNELITDYTLEDL